MWPFAGRGTGLWLIMSRGRKQITITVSLTCGTWGKLTDIRMKWDTRNVWGTGRQGERVGVGLVYEHTSTRMGCWISSVITFYFILFFFVSEVKSLTEPQAHQFDPTG